MPNRTWRFRSVCRDSGATTAHEWKWEVSIGQQRIGESKRLFSTLTECVQDAQRCGFAGDVDAATGLFLASEYRITTHDDGGATLSPLC